MVVLGVDPGSLRTGYGLVRCGKGSIVHLAHGTIVLDKQKSVSERLADLAADLNTIIAKYQPSASAVEDVFLFKNPRSALILGQARGAVLAMLGMHGIKTETMSATKVKSLVTGRGQAQKFQVAEILALQLGIVAPSSKDASDALAVALAYALQLRRL